MACHVDVTVHKRGAVLSTSADDTLLQGQNVDGLALNSALTPRSSICGWGYICFAALISCLLSIVRDTRLPDS